MDSRVQPTRRQLTLFVPDGAARELEAVRRVLDPTQSRLIGAHVTFCREDELARIPANELHARIADARIEALTLRFGRAERFHGHGIVLHCLAGEPEFHAARVRLLGTSEIRVQRPHITLAHPRNPKAPGNDLSLTSALPDDLSIAFRALSLIEQTGGEPWRVLRTFELQGSRA